MDFRSLTAGLSLKRRLPASAPAPQPAARAPPPAPAPAHLDYFAAASSAQTGASGAAEEEDGDEEEEEEEEEAGAEELEDAEEGVDAEEAGEAEGEEGGEGVRLFGGGAAAAAAAAGAGRKRARPADDAAGAAADAARALRRSLGLRVSGQAPPPPLVTFGALPAGLPAAAAAWLGGGGAACSSEGYASARAAVLAAVEASAYKEPTAVQMQALPALLAGRDVLACSPTGSGKTAAFLLPLLLLLQRAAPDANGGPRALILVPTRELAAQTLRECLRLGAGLTLRAACLTRESASAVAGRRVSASACAGDLVRDKAQRRRSGGGGGGGKRSARDGGAAAQEEEEEEEEEGGGEDDVLRWTDDEEEEEAGKEVGARAGAGSGAADSAAAAEAQLVAPRLPRCDILVATPLLLAAVLRSAGSAQGAGGAAPRRAVLPSVRHLVLDEVDNLLETGFLEQVDEVMSALPTPELLRGLARGADGERAAQYLAAAPTCAVQQAMFTATLPSGIEELAFTVLKNPVRIVAGKAGAAAPAVAQRLLFVGTERGKVMALQGMLAEGVTPPVLVFVQSKERADQVAQVLHQEGVQAGVIHGDRSAAQREEAITAFRRGDSMFLVTTDVLGRGLDFKGVNLVVNFDLPQSAVSYVHRVGRTGRAGRQGQAVTFFTEDDIPLLRSIANVMALSGCAVPPWMLQLRQLQQRDKKRLARSAPVRRDVLRGAHGRGGRGGRGGSSSGGGASGGRPRDGFKLSGGGGGGGRGRRRGGGRE